MIKQLRARYPALIPLCILIVLLAVIFLVGIALRGGFPAAAPEPTYPELDPNPYTADQFYYDGDFIRCEGVPCKVGIDVSEHQGHIDWEAVAESGVEFAIIRAGYRGYEQGGLYVDSMFLENMDGAIAAGLDVGVYFYSQATTPMEAKAEAALVLAAIDGYELTYPVVFDWEWIGGDARTAQMTSTEVTACAQAFCQMIEENFLTPCVYFNQALAASTFRLRELQEYDFWLAQYDDAMTFAYDVELWQYTNTGSVPGIRGNVDIDLAFGSYGG